MYPERQHECHSATNQQRFRSNRSCVSALSRIHEAKTQQHFAPAQPGPAPMPLAREPVLRGAAYLRRTTIPWRIKVLLAGTFFSAPLNSPWFDFVYGGWANSSLTDASFDSKSPVDCAHCTRQRHDVLSQMPRPLQHPRSTCSTAPSRRVCILCLVS